MNMMKRIWLPAVLVGLILSLSAPAWAASYAINGIITEYTTLYNAESREGGPLSIKIRVVTGGTTDTVQQIATNAEKLLVELDTDATITDPVVSSTEGTKVSASSVLFDLDVNKTNYDVKLTGKIAASGTIKVTAYLKQSDGSLATRGNGYDDTEEIITREAEIELLDEDGIDERTDVFSVEPYAMPDSDSSETLDNTAADPESSSWNGIALPVGSGDQGDPKNKLKIATSKLTFAGNAKALTSGKAETFTIEIDGPTPSVDVYVSYKDAKKLWPLSKDRFKSDSDNVSLTKANILKHKLPFRVISADIKTTTDQTKNTKHYITIAYNGAKVAYKSFPLTVSATNKATTKPVTKTYKLEIASSRATPQWVTPDGVLGENLKDPVTGKASKNADSITVRLDYSGRKVFGTSYTVSADAPYHIDAKGSKDGITAKVHQPVLNKYGEVVTPGYVVVSGDFATAKTTDSKGNSKEAKVALTFTAEGSSKKTKFKATVVGKVSPYFVNTVKLDDEDDDDEASNNALEDFGYLSGIKRAAAGKVPSVKFSAKGSKTISYSIDEDSLEALNDVNLSFDCAKGAVVALKSGSKTLASLPTVNDSLEFESVDITVIADNGTGKKAQIHAQVGVTGDKPTLNSSSTKLNIPSDAEEGTEFVISCDIAKKAVKPDDENNNIIYSVDVNAAESLAELGLELVPYEDRDEDYRNCGVIRVGEDGIKKATKGTKIALLLDNLGATNKGNVTITISDPEPEIVVTGDEDSVATDASTSSAITKEIALALTHNTQPTNGAKITWSAALDTKINGVSAKVTAGNNYTATLKVTIKKKLKDDYDGKVVVTAKNKDSGLTGTIEIPVSVSGVGEDTSVRASNVAGPEATPETQAETQADSGSALTFGPARSVSSLGAAQDEFIRSNGLTVIAVLPEVSANVEGLADIDVELYEDAPVGARLVWLPFPKDVEETEDDRIAEFYDVDGAPIERVPAVRAIGVSAWMRPGVIYQPVVCAEK